MAWARIAPATQPMIWSDDVQRGGCGPDLAAEEHDQGDGRIEVRAGDRPQRSNQHVENGGGRERVSQKGDAVISRPKGHSQDA